MKLSRRQFLCGVAASALFMSSEASAFIHGGSGPILAPSWKTLPIGAGGFIQGMSIGFDGTTQTLMVRTDTYDAYRWDPNGTSPIGTLGTWTPLITALSMPADYVNGSASQASQGVYSIDMCYSTPSVVYMMAPDVNASNTNNFTVFKSTNRGDNWARTGFTPIPGSNAPPNDSTWKGYGPKMCINPNDPTKLYVGSQPTAACTSGTISGSVLTVAGATVSGFAVGQWVYGAGVTAGTKITSLGTGSGGNGTYNLSASSTVSSGVPMNGCPTALLGLAISADGGSTWNPVSASLIPPSTSGGCSGMCWSRSNPLSIFIVSNGNGVYHSADGGTTWSKLTAGTGPAAVYWADIDENNGNYWAMDETTGKLWLWNGTTWSNPITASGGAFAIDPATANHVVFNNGTSLFETTNGTSFSTGSPAGSYSGDVGWITNVASPNFGGGIPLIWDRTGLKTIYGASNLGPWLVSWTGSISSGMSPAPAFAFRGRGIEQQVGLEVVVPPGGSPVPCVWDNGLFYKPSPINTSFPSIIRPSNTFGTQTAAWSCDYAFATPTTLVMVGDGQYEGGSSQAAKSTDGGNTWASIQSTMPISQSNGACVAVSTTTNYIFGDGNTRQPYYTANGGSSWTAITLPGTPSWSGFGGFQGRGKWIIADKVNSGNFAMFFNGLGVFITTNGGPTFTGPFGSLTGFTHGGDAIFKPVPGQAGHAFICDPIPGATGGGGLLNQPISYTTNLFVGSGLAWTTISNVGLAYNFGFGAAAPGKSYPTVGFFGYTAFTCSNSVAVGTGTLTFNLTGAPAHTITPGAAVTMCSASTNKVVRGSVVSYSGGVLTTSIDTVIAGSGSASDWVAQILGLFVTEGNAAPGATPLWTQLGTFPNNSLDVCQGVSGHPDIYRQWFLSFGGSSFAYFG